MIDTRSIIGRGGAVGMIGEDLEIFDHVERYWLVMQRINMLWSLS